MEPKNDIGIVTPSGIWFNGKIYSCSLAIRQQWFKLSEQIGGWPVVVQYHEDISDEIQVMLQDGSAVECVRIDHITVNPAKLHAYYVEFQRLAALRKEQQAIKNLVSEDFLHSDQSDKPITEV